MVCGTCSESGARQCIPKIEVNRSDDNESYRIMHTLGHGQFGALCMCAELKAQYCEPQSVFLPE